jgi:hypothetical protein
MPGNRADRQAERPAFAGLFCVNIDAGRDAIYTLVDRKMSKIIEIIPEHEKDFY